MEIEYNITENDYVKSTKLAVTPTRKQLVWLTLSGLGLLLLGLFGPSRLKSTGYFGLIGGVLGYFVIIYFVSPLQSKRTYRKYKPIQGPFKLEVAESGLTVRSANGVSNMKWDQFLKWREDKNYLQLYFAPKLYYLVPKRIAEKGFDIQPLRRLLQEKIGNPTR